MIMNPVIQGGGAEKVYKITNTTQIGFPTSATAGSFVFGYGNPGQNIDIYGDIYDYAHLVPYNIGPYPIPSGVSARMPQDTYSFVMPASDVTVE